MDCATSQDKTEMLEYHRIINLYIIGDGVDKTSAGVKRHAGSLLACLGGYISGNIEI